MGVIEAVHKEKNNFQSIKVTILSPVNSEPCPHAVAMQGEVFNLPNGKELWLVNEPHPDNFHPNTGPVMIDGKKWIGTAFIGNDGLNADTGKRFKIHLVLCDRETGEKYKDYLVNAHRTGGWVGLPTLFAGKSMATVEVVRSDAVACGDKASLTEKTPIEDKSIASQKGLIRKVWHDPVWSKVIAATIIAIVGLLWKFTNVAEKIHEWRQPVSIPKATQTRHSQSVLPEHEPKKES